MSDQTGAPPEGLSQIILYKTEDGLSRIHVRMGGETVWLSLKQIVELYQRDKSVVSRHIKNIFEDGELDRKAVVAEYATTAADGKTYSVSYYNLNMIIAVGYRVRSPRGVQFRQWATERLREYLVKGFILDDDRLKGRDRVADYFDELLARIRDIRASEKRAYQRIREIFAFAVDYQEGDQETQVFFAVMQNKMHFAATGMTAAEIVRGRADADQVNMGLTAWSGGRVLKRDVSTAKNYLTEKEIDTLNRIVVMFLDQAEFRAQRRQDIKMRDCTVFLDKFLRDTDLPVLEGSGSVSREDAISWAEAQCNSFAERRRLETEMAAEARYLDDLQSSAEAFDDSRKKASAKQAKRRSKRTRKSESPTH